MLLIKLRFFINRITNRTNINIKYLLIINYELRIINFLEQMQIVYIDIYQAHGFWTKILYFVMSNIGGKAKHMYAIAESSSATESRGFNHKLYCHTHTHIVSDFEQRIRFHILV